MGQTWNGDLLHDAGNVVSDIGGFVAGPPGDPGRIRQAAARIEQVQHEYGQHARAVNEAVDELLQTWSGTGAAAFRERWHGGGSGQSPAQVLSGVADQLGALANQLRDYADQLEHAQHEHWIQLAVMGALTVANVVQLGLDPVTDAAEVGAAATMEVGTGLALADVGTFAIQGAFAGFASDVVAQLEADVFDHLDGGFDQSGGNAVALLNPGELVLSTAAGGAGGALLGGAVRPFNSWIHRPTTEVVAPESINLADGAVRSFTRKTNSFGIEAPAGSAYTYGAFKAATNPGAMAGARGMRTIETRTGETLAWQYETYDAAGNVRSIRPQWGSVQGPHFLFDIDGNLLGWR